MNLLRAAAAGFAVLAGVFVAGPGLAAEPVPFVGCAGDGQMGPVAAPIGGPASADVSAKTARQLALYVGHDDALQVLGPKGWRCFYAYGSNGDYLIVAPSRRIEKLGAQYDGPSIVIEARNGGTSGRFEVARFAARFFAAGERGFIDRVANEGILPKDAFPIGPRAGDVLFYRSPHDVVFKTARQGGDVVEGRAVLLGPADQPDLALLTVRLPEALRGLAPLIIDRMTLPSALQART